MPEMNEALKEFLVESHENLSQLDQDLVALEQDPTATANIGSVFRTVHTLKGSAGFLGFKNLESLSHVGESLLSRLRDGKQAVNAEIITALLALVDAVREILATIESTGQEGERDDAVLRDKLTELRTDKSSTAKPARSRKDDAAPAERPAETKTAPPPAPLPHASGTKGDSSVTLPLEMGSSFFSGSSVTISAVAESTIRLDVSRLDKLMNLVSELVLARNQILQQLPDQADPALAAASRNVNLITSQLQEVVMSARMLPIENIWSKFPRVVRDLATSCGKHVRLEMLGSDTELDRSVIEAIKDPLTHLVRNSVDHGIEMPEMRSAAGKPVEGRLTLRAYHESGYVQIEISDDGAGIDPHRIKNKAIERGLISVEQAAQLSEYSTFGLIFLPGFSTADQVTNVSGRGVGMDVVKNNIEKIGGVVDVQSRLGAGTTIKMRIPLTLAIIRALIVSSQGQRFAIPQASMIELIRLEGDKARAGIERVHGVNVYRYRGKLLPIVYLNRVLNDESESPADSAQDSEIVTIAVVQTGERQLGLIVDRVIDTQEIVVKPLSKLLRGVPCLAGATIMGDGRVAIILDVHGLALRAGVSSRTQTDSSPESISTVESGATDIQQQLVLVRGVRGERMAVPLAMVARLEELPASSVEWSGRPVIQYRGRILPLVDVVGRLQADASDALRHPVSGVNIHVVVCTDGERCVGLLVDRILDIVFDPLLVKGRAAREHVLFTAVVERHVTEVLDVAELIGVGEAAVAASAIAGAGS